LRIEKRVQGLDKLGAADHRGSPEGGGSSKAAPQSISEAQMAREGAHAPGVYNAPMRRGCIFCEREALTAAACCARHVDDVSEQRLILERLAREGAGRGLVAVGLWLQGLALHGCFLEHADFADTMLDGADLSSCDLERAGFGRARLRGADLSGSRLQVANFQDADLAGAHLDACHLEGATFSDAQMAGASLRGALMTGTQVRGADLTGADLRDLRALRVSFSGSNLTGVDLRGAELREISALDVRGLDTVLLDDTTRGADALRAPPAAGTSDSGRPSGHPPRPSELTW
jgi:uncharacterized protein YjbI with pentapeptide repeats